MEILELRVVNLGANNICMLGILSHGLVKKIEVKNMFSPDIVSDIIVNISQVSDICYSLVFCPFLIDSFCKLPESLLQLFKVLIIPWKHMIQIPFYLTDITIKVVTVHVFGTLLGMFL